MNYNTLIKAKNTNCMSNAEIMAWNIIKGLKREFNRIVTESEGGNHSP